MSSDEALASRAKRLSGRARRPFRPARASRPSATSASANVRPAWTAVANSGTEASHSCKVAGGTSKKPASSWSSAPISRQSLRACSAYSAW